MKRVAIIDFDPMCYELAIQSSEIVPIRSGKYDPETGLELPSDRWTTVFRADYMRAKAHAWVEHIKEAVGAEQAELCFTDRKTNFRTGFYGDYKANRDQYRDNAPQKPIYLGLTTELCFEEFDGWRWPTLEGDDVCGILATSEAYWPDLEPVIVSIDKDMKTIPGLYYNPRKPELGVQPITAEDAHFNHMLQTVMGDRTDGYPGVSGLGEKRATDMLLKVKAEGGDYWPAVLKAYEKAGQEPSFAVDMARCAYILQARHYDLKRQKVLLWQPPT